MKKSLASVVIAAALVTWMTSAFAEAPGAPETKTVDKPAAQLWLKPAKKAAPPRVHKRPATLSAIERRVVRLRRRVYCTQGRLANLKEAVLHHVAPMVNPPSLCARVGHVARRPTVPATKLASLY